MFILDTNVISELMKPAPDAQVQAWLTITGDIPMATTVITVSEIEFGLQRLPDGRRKDDLHKRFIAFISALGILPFEEAAALLAGQFRAAREAMGLSAAPSDMMIAGIVEATNGVLITRNTRDFDTLPIHHINPWRAS